MYEALYRKYRPKTFDDVVGQPFITETLKTQVRTGRLSHAYLFIGTRGTGKTSCARILAKAVNCEHPVDGNPCNECDACRGIEDGSVLDVVELDAASNNGVDDVRMLRDEAIFSPTTVRKRVYIIDEVHMLSKPAFNALLKILEEPPQHLMSQQRSFIRFFPRSSPAASATASGGSTATRSPSASPMLRSRRASISRRTRRSFWAALPTAACATAFRCSTSAPRRKR